ncbi:membrane protein [Spirochaetia bacterium]|nr:membrane protein [Spirochaetia bacterium]
MRTRAEIEAALPREGDTFDVIVAGGGPAGIGAALGAAVNGAKTLLLEAKAFFGGVAAVSGWMPMNRLLLKGKSRGGVHELFVGKLKSMGSDACREGKTSWVDGDGLHVHPDYLRLGVMELLEEHHCSYLLDSPVTGVEMQGKSISALVCDGKYGRRTYAAKVYIDASGDGDLAYYAGVPFHKGREEDGVFMPVTLGFVLGNVDEEKLFAFHNMHNAEIGRSIREYGKGKYLTSAFYSFDRTTVPGIVSVNNAGQEGIGIIDATNINDVNVSHRTALQVAFDFIRMARELKIPGLENCSLVRTGAELGVRETRRIEGEYTLTLEDAQQGKEFEDTVARRYGTIDPGGLKEDKNYHGSIKDGHDYPYRCMLPKEVDPLLVTGRCASLTHLGLATCKSMGNMMGIGQAAGVAAALSAKEGIIPRKIDADKIRELLREMKVEI